MKKVNQNIYNKLLAQATEAKEQGFDKLASGVLSAIGPFPEDELNTYSYKEMNDDIYNGLWKLASNIIKYHNLDNADIEKLDAVIESLASNFVEELEEGLNIQPFSIGAFEPKLPGESK